MNETIADNNRLVKIYNRLQVSRNKELNKEIKEIKEKMQNAEKTHQEATKALQVENGKLKKEITALKGKNWNFKTQLERSEQKCKELLRHAEAEAEAVNRLAQQIRGNNCELHPDLVALGLKIKKRLETVRSLQAEPNRTVRSIVRSIESREGFFPDY